MTLGVMQPYFYPYIGYWQLINAVDKFIFLDDVSFIKQGFINRNSILFNDESCRININVKGISSNKNIVDHELDGNIKWKKKLIKTLSQAYSKAPEFEFVFPLIEESILSTESNLSVYLQKQIISISKYLQLNTKFDSSSSLESFPFMGQKRIIELCRSFNAKVYINSIGGQKLYSKTEFNHNKIDLKFIQSKSIEYDQFGKEFIPSLSMIDVLMFNKKEVIKEFLNMYTLI